MLKDLERAVEDLQNEQNTPLQGPQGSTAFHH
jgi:hypothetical protein